MIAPVPVHEPCKCGKLTYALKAVRECGTLEAIDASERRQVEALARRLIWPALVTMTSITLCLIGFLAVPALDGGNDALAIALATIGSCGTLFGAVWLVKLDTDRRFVSDGHALAREILLCRDSVAVECAMET